MDNYAQMRQNPNGFLSFYGSNGGLVQANCSYNNYDPPPIVGRTIEKLVANKSYPAQRKTTLDRSRISMKNQNTLLSLLLDFGVELWQALFDRPELSGPAFWAK